MKRILNFVRMLFALVRVKGITTLQSLLIQQRHNLDSSQYRLTSYVSLTLFAIFASAIPGHAAPDVIATVAGDGAAAYSGDNGPATSASLNYPSGVAVDSYGNIYIADYYNSRVRKVTPGGTITTVAGTGTFGFSGDSGDATLASLSLPSGVAVDSIGNIYIADSFNFRIRKVDAATGVITTVAGKGTAGFPAYSGENGLATNATLSRTHGVAVDSVGNIYLSDYDHHSVRKVTAGTGIITTVAGTGVAGYSGDSVLATSAMLNYPYGVAVDSSGNIYIADTTNLRIRMVDAITGFITTVAGTGVAGYSGDNGPATSATLKTSWGVAVDSSGNIYIADCDNRSIRKVDKLSGNITTVAGTGVAGFSGDGGDATLAMLKYPYGVGVDSTGNIYIADSQNNRIRKVEAGASTSYTVSYISNGGSSVASQSVAYNTATTAPTPPTKTGYTFAGWYSDVGLTTVFAFTTVITSDTTLYAKWTSGSPLGNCTSTNATVTYCEVTNIPAGQSGNFTPKQAVSIGLTGVTGSANICITFNNPPSNPVLMKFVNGAWGKIYPGNPQWSGISNVAYNNGQICFTLQDNSDADGDNTLGTIADPVVIGYDVAQLGDLDGDGTVEIQDAIVALQVVSGSTPASLTDWHGDVNGNQKIDLSEAIFALQYVAGLRDGNSPLSTGSLTIVKDAVPNDAQDFAFYSFGPNSGSIMPFLLDDDAGAAGADNLLSNTKTFANLAPGSYSVTEDFFNPVPVTGWDLTGIICTSSTGMTVGTVDLAIRAFTVNLAVGDNVTCTFTNTKLPPVPSAPDLSVTKTSVVSYQGITYTLTVTNNGTVPTVNPIVVTDTVVAAPANSVFNFNGYGTACAAAGANTAICTSASPLAANGGQVTFTFGFFVPTNGSGSWSGSVTNCATLPADSDLSNNQACVTDTVGTEPTTGTITIVKDAAPDDPQDFFFLFGNSGGSFVLDDDGGADSTYLNHTTLAGLAAGSWTFTENAVTGWELTGISCSPSAGTTVDLPNRTMTVNLTGGANVTCTFTNTKQQTTSTGPLTIVKDAAPNDAQDFAFYAFGPNSGSIMPFLLDDDAGAAGADNLLANTKTFANLAPGSYSVTEDFFNPVPVTGWDLAGIVCTSSTGITVGTVDLANRAFTVNLAAGDNVTCTFTNTKVPPMPTTPDLSVMKTSVVSYQGITYTITVTNNGTVPTVNPIVVTDTVVAAPANSVFNFNGFGTACAAAGANTAICTSASPLAANGGQVTFTFGFFVPSNGSGSWSGSVTNCATVPADSDLGNNQACVTDTVGTVPTTGTITIVKDAAPDDPQDFFFLFGNSGGSFVLDDDGGADSTYLSHTTLAGLAAGPWTFTENAVTGWELTGISCTPSAGTTVDLPTRTVTVNLAAGDNVTCTFTNTKLPDNLTFTAVNGPTLQVSTQAMVPTLLMTPTAFTSTTTGGVTTATVTAGPAGVPNDGIFTLVSPYSDSLVGAIATLPGSILLTSGPLSMTSTSLGSSAGLVHADFGGWAIRDAVTPPMPANAVITYITFAGGTQLTTTMPTSGTATYTGKMTGVLANTPIGGSDDVSGNVTLNIDFGAGTISGSLGLMPGVVTTPGVSTITPCVYPVSAPACTYTAYAPPLNVPFNDITLSNGTITGNSFSATVTTPAITGATTMTMTGNFYGATANEVAGTFTISAPSPGMILIGSFGAKL